MRKATLTVSSQIFTLQQNSHSFHHRFLYALVFNVLYLELNSRNEKYAKPENSWLLRLRTPLFSSQNNELVSGSNIFEISYKLENIGHCECQLSDKTQRKKRIDSLFFKELRFSRKIIVFYLVLVSEKNLRQCLIWNFTSFAICGV